MKQFQVMNKFKKLALKVKEVAQLIIKYLDISLCSELQILICVSGLQVIAESLPEEEIKGIQTIFDDMMNTEKSSFTKKQKKSTYEELKTRMNRLGYKLSETEVKQLMEAVSIITVSLLPAYILISERENLKHICLTFLF